MTHAKRPPENSGRFTREAVPRGDGGRIGEVRHGDGHGAFIWERCAPVMRSRRTTVGRPVTELPEIVSPPTEHAPGLRQRAGVVMAAGNTRNAGQTLDLRGRLAVVARRAVAQLSAEVLSPTVHLAGRRHDASVSLPRRCARAYRQRNVGSLRGRWVAAGVGCESDRIVDVGPPAPCRSIHERTREEVAGDDDRNVARRRVGRSIDARVRTGGDLAASKERDEARGATPPHAHENSPRHMLRQTASRACLEDQLRLLDSKGLSLRRRLERTPSRKMGIRCRRRRRRERQDRLSRTARQSEGDGRAGTRTNQSSSAHAWCAARRVADERASRGAAKRAHGIRILDVSIAASAQEKLHASSLAHRHGARMLARQGILAAARLFSVLTLARPTPRWANQGKRQEFENGESRDLADSPAIARL